MSKKKPGIKHMGNRELAMAMFARRLSSAASPHKDRRTRRLRTRAAARAKAILND